MSSSRTKVHGSGVAGGAAVSVGESVGAGVNVSVGPAVAVAVGAELLAGGDATGVADAADPHAPRRSSPRHSIAVMENNSALLIPDLPAPWQLVRSS
jgi:hypothetical protein